MNKLVKNFLVIFLVCFSLASFCACDDHEHVFEDEHTCHDRVCVECGETVKSSVDNTITKKLNVVAATCERDGSYSLVTYCLECDTILSEERVTVSALGHSYQNGVCTRCGRNDPTYTPQSQGNGGSSSQSVPQGTGSTQQETGWKQTWKNDSKLSLLPVPSFSNCSNIYSNSSGHGAVFSNVSSSQVQNYMSALRSAGWSVSSANGGVNYYANKSGTRATFGYVNGSFSVVVS